MLQRLPAQEGESLATPLSHPEMRVLADKQEVAGDAAPNDVYAIQVHLQNNIKVCMAEAMSKD